MLSEIVTLQNTIILILTASNAEHHDTAITTSVTAEHYNAAVLTSCTKERHDNDFSIINSAGRKNTLTPTGDNA